MSRDIREVLRDAAPTRDATVDTIVWIERRAVRRTATRWGVAAVAFVSVAAGVFMWRPGTRSPVIDAPPVLVPSSPLPTLPQSTDPPDPADPSPRRTAATESGDWSQIPSAPIEARTDHAAVWTGREMIVWGGTVTTDPSSLADCCYQVIDGAAYDPGTATWRRIADAPLAPTYDPSVVWTGTEMLVWGGIGADVGAAYDPAADEWRMLAPSPLGERRANAAVWTGTELLIWGGLGEGCDPGSCRLGDGAAYDPVTDTWRLLPPGPIHPGARRIAVWTGRTMIIGGNDSGEDSTEEFSEYDPEADTWRQLAIPDGIGLTPEGVWTDAGLVVMGDRSAWLLPPGGRWDDLPGTPGRVYLAAPDLVSGDGTVYACCTGEGRDRGRGLAFDVAARAWSFIAPPLEGGLHGASIVWSGDAMLLWGGLTNPGPEGRNVYLDSGFAYRPPQPGGD